MHTSTRAPWLAKLAGRALSFFAHRNAQLSFDDEKSHVIALFRIRMGPLHSFYIYTVTP